MWLLSHRRFTFEYIATPDFLASLGTLLKRNLTGRDTVLIKLLLHQKGPPPVPTAWEVWILGA